jgi:RNA polymerase sigma factor (sigma-70 family)
MTHMATGSVVRQLGALFRGGSVAGLSDRQLLERYTAGGHDPVGEAAFAALVARHGPMVGRLCRQLLGDVQHAEDAFQAVFLVLAQKARSIRDPDLLGNWLYGVAVRTAQCARQQVARRRQREESDTMSGPGTGWCSSAEPTAPPADHPAIDREQAEALHVEVDRLPHAFRLPVVLCYFEGLTIDEAARRLRCPSGTLHSRLARAREKLRRSLLQRGFVLSTTAMAAALTPRPASASVSSLLCDSTTRAAIAFAARHAAVGGLLKTPAAAVAQKVLRTMLIHKLKIVALTVLFLGAIATGAGYHWRSAFAQSRSREGEPPGEPIAQQARTEPRPPGNVGRGSHDPAQPPDRRSPGEDPARMTVVGRVLDPQGKPVPGASVAVYAVLKQPGNLVHFGAMRESAIGHAESDGSAHFRLGAPRTSSSAHERLRAVAIAPGYGAGWVDLDRDAEEPAADIALRPERVIHGRLFDLQGQPARGVRVSVEAMGHAVQNPDASPDRVEGPSIEGRSDAKSPPAWPSPTTTDADGRFTVRGVGQGLRIILLADDPRFARERIIVDPEGTNGSKPVTAALEPARVFTGRVTDAGTGQPVPRVTILILAYRGNRGFSSNFETDSEGRFRGNPITADHYNVSARVPEGQLYLNAAAGSIRWPKGAIEHRLDLVLSRGTLIQGKVTEEGSGRPVARAMLGYFGRPPEGGETDAPGPRNGYTQTGPDGSFRLAVLPRPGMLAVLGPSEDYVHQMTGHWILIGAGTSGARRYAHAFIPCDLKPGTETLEVNVVLRRGATVKARVIGPNGQPVPDAWMLSRTMLHPQHVPWRAWHGTYHGEVRDGHGEIHGLPPDAEVPVSFLDARHKWGATVLLTGRPAAGGSVTVQLQPCGAARARLIGPDGRPIAGFRDPRLIAMIVSPGPLSLRTVPPPSQPVADLDALSAIDPINYANPPTSDAEGRIAFPALIPGATYIVRTFTANRRLLFHKEFTVKPGETIDLGDIQTEQPQ